MPKVNDISQSILNLIFNYRRSIMDAHGFRHYCQACNHPHLERIRNFVAKNVPIQFVLPAFPAKSPNLNKVLDIMPDKGEEIALNFLNWLCESIQNIYSPGASITICSDGHIFGDLIQVPDSVIDGYQAGIDSMITQLSNLQLFSLHDLFPFDNLETKRTRFIKQYTSSIEEIRIHVKKSARELSMFRGIKKFMLGDLEYLEPHKSKTFLQKKAHRLSYELISRSHGWSDVIANYFPEAVRLSIHPQPCHFEKIGISLLPTKDNWLTPWHGVALLNNGKFELVKKMDALELEAELVSEKGRGSYYRLSP